MTIYGSSVMDDALAMAKKFGEIYVEDRFIRAIDVSTNEFPTVEQFEVFRDAHRDVTEVELLRSEDDSFPAHQVVWDLGRLIFTSTELPGKGYAHRWRHMRKGSLDHWYVTIPFCRSGIGPGRLTTEAPSLHCLAKPFEAETDGDGLLTLYMPRDLFPAMSAFEVMLDLQLEGGRGLLLSDYLVLLNRSLTGLRLAEVPHVVEATRCLIAACLAPSRDRLAEARRPIDTIVMERARTFIARKLADPDLTPETLCAELGVSRSRLYRLFEPLGGIFSLCPPPTSAEDTRRIVRQLGRDGPYRALPKNGASRILPHTAAHSDMNSACRRVKPAQRVGAAAATSSGKKSAI